MAKKPNSIQQPLGMLFLYLGPDGKRIWPLDAAWRKSFAIVYSKFHEDIVAEYWSPVADCPNKDHFGWWVSKERFCREAYEHLKGTEWEPEILALMLGGT